MRTAGLQFFMTVSLRQGPEVMDPHAGSGEAASAIVRLGFNVSPVSDRRYFHSIYCREPGGVLFEIATNARLTQVLGGDHWTSCAWANCRRE